MRSIEGMIKELIGYIKEGMTEEAENLAKYIGWEWAYATYLGNVFIEEYQKANGLTDKDFRELIPLFMKAEKRAAENYRIEEVMPEEWHMPVVEDEE